MQRRSGFLSAFTAASIGLASVFTSSVAFAEEPKAHIVPFQNTRLVNLDTESYIPPPFPYRLPPASNADPNNIQALYYESAALRFDALLTQRVPEKIIKRHAGIGAQILKAQIDQVYGGDAPVFFHETSERIYDTILDHQDPQIQDLFNTTYIAMAIGFNPAEPFKGHAVSTKDDVTQGDIVWDGNFIQVIPSGNSRDDYDIEQAPMRPYHTTRRDTLITTGRAERTEDGTLFITDGSGFGYTQPTFSLISPWEQGAKSQYIRTPQQVRERLHFLASHIFHAPNNEDQDSLRPYFGTSVLAQIADGLLNPIKVALQKRGADDDGYIDNITGTSWIPGKAIGMLAGMHKRHPELTEYDIYMAAILACDPIALTYTEDDNKVRTAEIVHYEHNGAGKYYNPKFAGYGFFDFEKFVPIVSAMATEQARNPELTTQRVKAESGYVIPDLETFESDGNVKRYAIDIDEDIMTLAANITLKLQGGKIPENVILVNPAGGRSIVVPMAPKDPNDLVPLSFGGHEFNTSKGRWIIEVEGSVAVRELSLSIRGAQRGGVIEKMAERHLDPHICSAHYPLEKDIDKLLAQAKTSLNPELPVPNDIKIAMIPVP